MEKITERVKMYRGENDHRELVEKSLSEYFRILEELSMITEQEQSCLLPPNF